MNTCLPCLATLLAALLVAMPVAALDFAKPATVRLQVVSETDAPLPDADILILTDGETTPIEKRTDAAGVATFALNRPDSALLTAPDWSVRIGVRLKGRIPVVRYLRPFPGAELVEKVLLDVSQTTRIRLRDPKGQPLAGLALQISYATAREPKMGQMSLGETDELGDFEFAHPPLLQEPSISNLGTTQFFSPTAAETTLVLADDARTNAVPRIPLKMSVRLADGTPAVGWYVAQRVASIGGGWFGRGSIHYYYQAKGVAQVGVDGRFAVACADERLAVISPQGLPFLFPLAPRTWTQGERHVTLQLPPVRRVQKGQLLDPDGKPVSHFPLDASNNQSCGQSWSLGATRAYLRGRVEGDWEHFSLAQDHIGEWMTDAEGRYEIPFHFGSRPSVSGSGMYRPLTPDLATNTQTTLRGSAKQDERLKQVTLTFKDEKGQALCGLVPRTYNGYAGDKHLISSGGSFLSDSRGEHLFVAPETDRLELKVGSAIWKDLETTVRLEGQDDRTVEIVMPEKLRRLPLHGTLLDPDGQPVEGARVSLFELRNLPRSANQSQQKHPHQLGLLASTDARGAFAFEAAPDECFVEISRWDRGGMFENLPGWTPPVAVTSETRELTVRLERCGSAKVLLPAECRPKSGELVRKSEDPPEYLPCRYTLACDTAAATWSAPYVRPGHYTLYGTAEGRSALAELDVRAGVETEVNLRQWKPTQPAKPDLLWQDLTVTLDGKPVSGAIVTAYSGAPGHEDEIRKLVQALGNEDFATREQAESKLKALGAPAILPLQGAATQTDPETSTRAKRILAEIAKSDDGCRTIFADLSDDAGCARFQGRKGETHVVVARLPGRFIGWKKFELAADKAVVIELRRARSLAVELTPKFESASPNYDPREVRLDAPGISPDERLALWRALGIVTEEGTGAEWARVQGGYLPRDSASVRLAEDLPVGQTYVLEVLRAGKVSAQREVRLIDGEPAVEGVQIEAPTK